MGDSKEFWKLSVSETIKLLKSSKDGLSEEEAEKRLGQYGLNEWKEKKQISRLSIFARQFRGLLVLILIAATVFSFAIGEVVDSIVILVILVLNAFFGFRQEYKAEKAVEALKRLASPKATVLRDGVKKTIETRYIVPGDIIFLEEGIRVPADIRIIESVNMKVDEASLTGESMPVLKICEAIEKAGGISGRKNMAFMGTAVAYGRGLGIAVSTAMGTEMGRIAEYVQETEEKLTPLQKGLDRFGRNLGVLIILICIAVAALGIFRQEGVFNSILIGIALAVAAIPEGLPAIVTITLALGMQRMARQKSLMRRLSAVETLGSVSVICADKTGTMTKNEMTVTEISAAGKIYNVSGSGYQPEGNFYSGGKSVNPAKEKGLSMLLKIGLLCNNSELRKNKKDWSVLGDPTEGALVVAAAKAFDTEKTIISEYVRKGEIPFSSERRRMSTINFTRLSPENKLSAGKYYLFMKGAPETVLRLSHSIYKNGIVQSFGSREKEEVLKTNEKMCGKALRVLGFAFRELKKSEIGKRPDELENNLVFAGLAGMIDPPRPEIKADVEICRKAGIKVVMVTGDNENTAAAIAKKIGITGHDSRILKGEELKKMSDREFHKIVEEVSVYARTEPLQKMKIVNALKANGLVVAMTGDGVNDAPAIKRADIGIAMGIKGTDVSKEASDMILEDDNFSTIVSAVKEGRGIYDNIKKFIDYLLSCNTGEVLVVFLAMLLGFANPETGLVILPLTAIQILWINLVTDGLPALAIGVDPPAEDIMERKPRSPKEKLMSAGMINDMVVFGGLMALIVLVSFWLELANGVGRAVTIAFTMIAIFEMVRALSVRTKYGLGMLSNSKLLIAIAVSVLAQMAVVYIPQLQVVFDTVAIGLYDWLVIAGLAVLLFAAMEAKRILRR
jgi:Ca2+-transporting ATPase